MTIERTSVNGAPCLRDADSGFELYHCNDGSLYLDSPDGGADIAFEQMDIAWLLSFRETAPRLPAPSKADRWTPGTGSELPNGTTGFVAWKAVNGYGVEFSHRRDGGWGSQEALSGDADEPAWADDGDPEFAGKEASVFGRHAITHYMLFELPAPPGGGK